MRSGTAAPPLSHQASGASRLPLVALDAQVPYGPAAQKGCRGDRPRGGCQGRGAPAAPGRRGCGEEKGGPPWNGRRRPRPPRGAGEPIGTPGTALGGWRTPVPGEVRTAPGGCPWSARPAIAARLPPRPPGSAGSSRSSCAGSSPASPSAPAAHSAWPRGSASCSCGSSCRVTTSWFRDNLGAARFLPPMRRPPPRTHTPRFGRRQHQIALRFGPAPLKSLSRRFTP